MDPLIVLVDSHHEVFHSNLSIERSWVPFRCWVSLFLTGFTSGITIWIDEGVINLAQKKMNNGAFQAWPKRR